ncbi:MAG: site-specific DNA-methyltransferase [Acidobacteria bacterium]|nr:site-specific DNA-methyltransferase [Acidobacteriota bacterium]
MTEKGMNRIDVSEMCLSQPLGTVNRALLPRQFANEIVCGDALNIMRLLPSGSVDLVVTSPPYNIRNRNGGMRGKGNPGRFWRHAALRDGYDGYSDDLPYDEYMAWQRACLTEMFRLISEDGAIFYNHKWRIQRGRLQDHGEIISGFPVRQIIIWRRKCGLNFSQRFFLPTYEVIYLITKPEFKLAPKANRVSDVWEIPPDRNNPHPAPFPVELPARAIGATTARTVLDPFMGSGTTAIAALTHGRTFVGIEQSPQYCEMACRRVDEFRRHLLNHNREQMR